MRVGPASALEIPHEGPEVGSRTEIGAEIATSRIRNWAWRSSRRRGVTCARRCAPPSTRSPRTRPSRSAGFDEGAERDAWLALDDPGQPLRGRSGQRRERCSPREPSTTSPSSSRSSPPASAASASARWRRPMSEPRTRPRSAGARRHRRQHVAARVPRPRGRRADGGHRGRRRRSCGQAGRGGRLPLLRPHLHDRLLPPPDRACRGSTRAASRCEPATGRPIDNLGRRGQRVGRAGRRRRRRPARPRRAAAAAGAADEGLRGDRRASSASTTRSTAAGTAAAAGRSESSSTAARQSNRRINGDAALEGYCYRGPQGLLRHVLPDEGARVDAMDGALEIALAAAGAAGRPDRDLVAVRVLDDRDDRPDRPHRRAARRRSRPARPSCPGARRRGAHVRRAGARRAPLHGAGGRLAYAVAAAIALAAARRRGARDARSCPRSAASCPSTGGGVMPMPLAAAPLRRPARARLHDLRPHLRRLGAGGDLRSRSATRRSGSRSALAFGVGRALPIVALAPFADRPAGAGRSS